MMRITRFGYLLILLFLLQAGTILPAGAYTVAMYGTGAGLDPALHPDSIVVARSLPGSSGSDLDAAVGDFIQPSVNVILLGGEASFSAATAATIESATAQGKILVVSYPVTRLFNASLPATNGDSVPAGHYLEIVDPAAGPSREIFRDLPLKYTVLGPVPEKVNAVARSGSTVLLADDTKTPSLLFWKYGNGTVIEWTNAPVPSYMSSKEADTIIDRIITQTLSPPGHSSITQFPNATSTTMQTVTTSIPTAISTSPASGDILIYSSPSGASVLIDGIYRGTTPANLTSIPQGNHILRLTMSGYYDYEGTVYILPGQINHAFGTLPPLSQISAAPTVIPLVVPIVTPEPTQTASKGLLENSSVVVAIIGVITASIAAAATIFANITKIRKDGKD